MEKVIELLENYKEAIKFILDTSKKVASDEEKRNLNKEIIETEMAIKELEDLNNRCCDNCSFFDGCYPYSCGKKRIVFTKDEVIDATLIVAKVDYCNKWKAIPDK